MSVEAVNKISKIFDIYHSSEGEIRPHFILTGPSGSGKSHTIQQMLSQYKIPYLEINAAQLTKEGTSGNSLSKALSPLRFSEEGLTVVFVDEFDKLFISGNTNSHLAHETTNGVQNEFLRILEGETTSVYDDYGHYRAVQIDKVLFCFAGAFNGETDIDLDRLREFGIKTEFLGRVGLVYNMKRLSLEQLEAILNNSPLLAKYLELFHDVKKEEVVKEVMSVVKENYDNNTLGARMLSTLLHQYFIQGGLKVKNSEVKKSVFKKTLSLR